MEQAYKLLSMSAGLIITCAVIGYGLLAYRECRSFGMAVLQEMQQTTEDYETSKWSRYEGAQVSGGEVVSVIRRYQKDIPVSVVQKNRTYTYTGSFRLADNVPARAAYIRYGDTYTGEVLYDEKDCLCGIRFYHKADQP